MSLTTTRAGAGEATRLPMPALLALGAATLVMVTAEMLPTAVLVPMSVGLGVTESLTGQLVATWALTVVVASLPLTRLTRRIDRRALIVTGLLGLAASSLATGLAPSFGVALGARLVGAAAVGLLWATANAHVADLVPEALLGRAVAMVLMGATLGMVIGTPLARVVADVTSWRVAFVVLAASAVAVALVVRAVVPSRARSGTGGGRDEAATEAASLAPTILVTGLVGLLLVGFYGTYTFITRLGEAAAALVPGGMGGLLLAFGLASAVGVAVAGRVRRPATGLVVASAATAVALLGLLRASEAPLGLVTILGLGVASGALPPLAQTEILRRAGTTHRDLASALIPVVFNGGIAVGAAVASLLVGRSGPSALPAPAAAAALVAAVGLAAAVRSRADIYPG
ncbi:MAG TPA: MFS transporter [Intrasporangium sp.]|uniref:MFS transporter n=1 Tax=Intrasporangium sp. TaxID=1925024 RepID=UPI002B4942F4|nr:MFS transporter [Intrasporangium sp.]HKX67108.1 MFS transporter [Intrasporangium sp.]